MSDAPSKKGDGHSSGAAVIVLMLLACFVLPILYCLSLGPAIWMVEHGANSSAFEIIYAPVEWLYDNVEFTRPLFDWYVELWR